MLEKSFLIINAPTVYSSSLVRTVLIINQGAPNQTNNSQVCNILPNWWVLTLIRRSIPRFQGSNTVEWNLEVAHTGSTCIARRSIYINSTSVARINSYDPVYVICNAISKHTDQVYIIPVAYIIHHTNTESISYIWYSLAHVDQTLYHSTYI